MESVDPKPVVVASNWITDSYKQQTNLPVSPYLALDTITHLHRQNSMIVRDSVCFDTPSSSVTLKEDVPVASKLFDGVDFKLIGFTSPQVHS